MPEGKGAAPAAGDVGLLRVDPLAGDLPHEAARHRRPAPAPELRHVQLRRGEAGSDEGEHTNAKEDKTKSMIGDVRYRGEQKQTCEPSAYF